MARSGLRQALLTALLSFLVAAAIVMSYVIAYVIATPLDPLSIGLAYVTSGLSVCVAGGFLVTVVMLIWLGVREYDGGLWRTAFFRPQLLKHACLLAVTGPSGLRGIDRILHHGVIGWTFFLDPEVIVLAILYYFGVLFFSLWFNGSWVATSGTDHRATWRRVIVACGVVEAVLIVGMVILYRLGS